MLAEPLGEVLPLGLTPDVVDEPPVGLVPLEVAELDVEPVDVGTKPERVGRALYMTEDVACT